MIDYETGAVTCDRCTEYIGNYLTEDFYGLIRTKYCPSCKVTIRKEQKREWAKQKRRTEKKRKQLVIEQNVLLKEENELLREKIKELRTS